MHVCSFLACTTCQHGRVLDCQMRRAPRRWHHAPRTHTVLHGGRVHCLKVTANAAGRDTDSTMNLSVTPRLPRLACNPPTPKPSTQRPPQNKEEHPNNMNFRMWLELRANPQTFRGKRTEPASDVFQLFTNQNQGHKVVRLA